MTVLEAKDLEFSYPNMHAPVLRGVSFSLQAGEEVALVGHGGAGKSTLARLLAGLLTPSRGSITVKGTDGTGRVGLVFQNPENQLIGLTVEEDIAFGPGNLGLSAQEIRRRVDEAIVVCGLEALRQRPLATLSGGEKQRVAIAGALSMHPTCLVLDEATAMLDQPSQDELNRALQRVKERLGIAVLRITHALNEALTADRVLILTEGRIVAEGAPWDVLWDPVTLQEWRLAVPPLYRAARHFVEANLTGCRQVRTPKELASTLWPWISRK